MSHVGPLVAAVDVGGTSVKGALVGSDGTLHHARRVLVADVGAARVVDTAIELMAQLIAAAGPGMAVDAVGLAVPGLVDEAAGVGRSSMILGWQDVHFGDLLHQFGRPVAFGHDVSSGAFAEARLGAARGRQDWLFLALGTGLGSTFVLDDRPYRGSNGTGGELAHVVVRPDGPICRCGKRGCLEMVASAPAIAGAYRERTGRINVSAADVARLAGTGDVDATAVWTDAVDALAEVVAGYTETMNPSVVVVGGGLAEAGPTLLEPLAAGVAGRVAFADPSPPVVAARFGDTAALVGIAMTAHQLLGRGGKFGVPFAVADGPTHHPRR